MTSLFGGGANALSPWIEDALHAVLTADAEDEENVAATIDRWCRPHRLVQSCTPYDADSSSVVVHDGRHRATVSTSSTSLPVASRHSVLRLSSWRPSSTSARTDRRRRGRPSSDDNSERRSSSSKTTLLLITTEIEVLDGTGGSTMGLASRAEELPDVNDSVRIQQDLRSLSGIRLRRILRRTSVRREPSVEPPSATVVDDPDTAMLDAVIEAVDDEHDGRPVSLRNHRDPTSRRVARWCAERHRREAARVDPDLLEDNKAIVVLELRFRAGNNNRRRRRVTCDELSDALEAAARSFAPSSTSAVLPRGPRERLFARVVRPALAPRLAALSSGRDGTTTSTTAPVVVPDDHRAAVRDAFGRANDLGQLFRWARSAGPLADPRATAEAVADATFRASQTAALLEEMARDASRWTARERTTLARLVARDEDARFATRRRIRLRSAAAWRRERERQRRRRGPANERNEEEEDEEDEEQGPDTQPPIIVSEVHSNEDLRPSATYNNNNSDDGDDDNAINEDHDNDNNTKDDDDDDDTENNDDDDKDDDDDDGNGDVPLVVDADAIRCSAPSTGRDDAEHDVPPNESKDDDSVSSSPPRARKPTPRESPAAGDRDYDDDATVTYPQDSTTTPTPTTTPPDRADVVGVSEMLFSHDSYDDDDDNDDDDDDDDDDNDATDRRSDDDAAMDLRWDDEEEETMRPNTSPTTPPNETSSPSTDDDAVAERDPRRTSPTKRVAADDDESSRRRRTPRTNKRRPFSKYDLESLFATREHDDEDYFHTDDDDGDSDSDSDDSDSDDDGSTKRRTTTPCARRAFSRYDIGSFFRSGEDDDVDDENFFCP